MILDYKNHSPKISDQAFMAPNATVIGEVEIGDESSVLFGAVVRGDIAPVRIGKRTDIQDLSVLHETPNLPFIIDDNVTDDHQVNIQSCTIKNGALIGMDSTILDEEVIGENSFIGAGSLVTGGTVIPPNMMAFGRPAKVVRELTEADLEEMKRINDTYVGHIANYKN